MTFFTKYFFSPLRRTIFQIFKHKTLRSICISGEKVIITPLLSYVTSYFLCLSRSEITGSPIYRPVNRPLTWVSSRPMQLCGYCSAHPASPRKQPRLWAHRPTQHSCLYPNLFVYSYATVRLSLWEIYIVLFCSVL